MNEARKLHWWESRPTAGRSYAALAKVFEMARCIPGSQDREEREDWEEWLDKVEAAWLGTNLPSCLSEPETEPPSLVPYPELRQLGPAPRYHRRCSLCGAVGHRKTTCALNPKNTEVESKPPERS
jgi:hypothetical protein